jgi:hypothetical protein
MFDSKGALDLLKKNGCLVDYAEFRARIPAAHSREKSSVRKCV